MKVVILAGGFGTRISEESTVRPKPLVEVGGRPILWHIMKIYSHYGLTDFIICGGYKCNMLKSYFQEFMFAESDVTFDLRSNHVHVHHRTCEPWNVTVIDTGLKTMTGGRLKRVQPQLNGEPFCMTYGDGVADIDIRALLECHRRAGALATVTAVSPPGRFGVLSIDPDTSRVTAFREKAKRDVAAINGGFFVLEPAVFDYIAGDDTIWEQEPLETLTREGKLAAYSHTSFWQNMDTLRDRAVLEQLWDEDRAPWKIW